MAIIPPSNIFILCAGTDNGDKIEVWGKWRVVSAVTTRLMSPAYRPELVTYSIESREFIMAPCGRYKSLSQKLSRAFTSPLPFLSGRPLSKLKTVLKDRTVISVVGSFGQTTVSNSAIGLKVSPTVDAVAGQPITLKATYQSTRSIVSLIWSKVEGDVGGRRAPVFVHYPGSEYSYGDLTGRADRTNGVSLRISRVKPSDEGYYVVQLLLDAVGQEEKEVYLNVLEPPKVYVGPGSPYVVRWGKNITLSCRVKAKPEITNLYWEKDGLPVRSFPRSKKYRGGNMRNPNLHVINVGKADAGKYGCVIDHVVESTRATLDLEVLSKFWSRSDTSIPTPNQSSLPTWIAASTPDTVPATPCPLVKRLQPLQRSLCNVCATFNRRTGNAGEAAVLKTFGAVGRPLQKRQRWPGVHGVALTGSNFCLAVVSDVPAKSDFWADGIPEPLRQNRNQSISPVRCVSRPSELVSMTSKMCLPALRTDPASITSLTDTITLMYMCFPHTDPASITSLTDTITVMYMCFPHTDPASITSLTDTITLMYMCFPHTDPASITSLTDTITLMYMCFPHTDPASITSLTDTITLMYMCFPHTDPASIPSLTDTITLMYMCFPHTDPASITSLTDTITLMYMCFPHTDPASITSLTESITLMYMCFPHTDPANPASITSLTDTITLMYMCFPHTDPASITSLTDTITLMYMCFPHTDPASITSLTESITLMYMCFPHTDPANPASITSLTDTITLMYMCFPHTDPASITSLTDTITLMYMCFPHTDPASITSLTDTITLMYMCFPHTDPASITSLTDTITLMYMCFPHTDPASITSLTDTITLMYMYPASITSLTDTITLMYMCFPHTDPASITSLTDTITLMYMCFPHTDPASITSLTDTITLMYMCFPHTDPASITSLTDTITLMYMCFPHTDPASITSLTDTITLMYMCFPHTDPASITSLTDTITLMYMCFPHTDPASITSLTESVSVALTDTITLQCFADGNPEPNITWTKEGAPVERMREIQTFSKGLRASALVLNYAERNDSGKYICTASNGLGKPDVRTLTLNVEGERALNSYTQIAIFAGAAAGGAWLIVCIILVIVYVRRRNQQRLRDDFAYYYAVGRRHFELARVVHKYAPQAEDELMLEVDDVLEIVKTDEGGWWVGYLKGKLGLFPFNYVDLLPEKASMGNGKAKSPLRADLTDSEYQALDPPQKQGPDRDSISLPDPLTGDSFSKATTLVAEKKEKDNPNLVACSGNR
ncbi:hypothetical protein Bbelb_137170 [Branchiostoma belcheri]|nr:hypothetical protein Bbelb_137170 [Branchiostoma belcheri]